MSESSSKRQRYINVFVIVKEVNTIEKIAQGLNDILKSKNLECNVEVKHSRVIPDFVYFKIVPKELVNLNELKEEVEKSLCGLKEEIVWSKIEVIEVR